MRPADPPLARLRLDGAPATLPRPLDLLSERWFRAGPRLRLALALALALAAAAAFTVRMTSSPWGPPTSVLVAQHDLVLGQDLTAGDVRADRWPADLVPADAVTALSDANLTVALPAGTVLRAQHLAGGGVAAALDTGQAAVAVPRDLLPAVPPGSQIDLVGAAGDGSATVLATAVPVLRVEDEDVWVAVARPVSADVAGAAAAGALTAVLLPP